MSKRDEISELISNYAWAMDAKDFEAFNDVFTEDASFSIELPETDTIGPFSPRTAVIEFIESTSTQMNDTRRHVATNLRFVKDGEDEVEVTSTLTLNATAEGKLRVLATGLYLITARREGGGWRIASLTILLDGSFD